MKIDSYGGIKNILEKELDKQNYFFLEEKKSKILNSSYARNIKELLLEV